MDTVNLTAIRNIDWLLSYVDYYYPFIFIFMKSNILLKYFNLFKELTIYFPAAETCLENGKETFQDAFHSKLFFIDFMWIDS